MNDYDWLGPGVYFWVDSPERALSWAQEACDRGEIKEPFVLGAVINPGLCLNLTDFGVMEDVTKAYEYLAAAMASVKTELPENKNIRDGVPMRRMLDCAVIRTMHQLREDDGLPPYDTVYGVFNEGESIYPGSGFFRKNHVQICVINRECIVERSYFRAPINLTT
jgi:hypothetical protein